MNTSSFPTTRMRRARQFPWLRKMVQEHQITTSDLIWPLFIIEGENLKTPINSMPDVYRYTVDLAVKQATEAFNVGIPCIALFPSTPDHLRSDNGQEAWNSNNLICRTIHAIKSKVPELGIMVDIALDPYTTHGHDGLFVDGDILNDATIEALVKQSLCFAKAGADILAPSDMMDGRIGSIRSALEQNNHHNILIMAYSAKYASSYYGPFRDAVGTNGRLVSDKKTYQMCPFNSVKEALEEALLDISEGADFIMVKPGLPYLDVLAHLAKNTLKPVFAYQVSGEYTMHKLAFANGILNPEFTILESLIAFKRAGASGIITYFAFDVAKILQNQA